LGYTGVSIKIISREGILVRSPLPIGKVWEIYAHAILLNGFF
jgi:hypothetical protein